MRSSGFLVLLAPLALLAPVALLAGCGASPAEQLAAAQQQFAAEDFVAARITLNELLRADSANHTALITLAATQLELGDADGARATLERARAAGVPAARLRLLAAAAALAAGRPQDALGGLGAEATAESWRIRAEAYLALGQPEQALAAFRRGLSRGDDPRLLESHARFLMAADDLAGAEALLGRLQSVAPLRYRTLMLSGALAEARGRLAVAEQAYGAAAKRYPTRIEPLVARSLALDSVGRLADAAIVIEQAKAIAPDSPDVVMAALRIMADRGEWQKVRDVLQRAEDALDPQGADAMLYAEALLQLGIVEQARARLNRTVLLQPGNVRARHLLAQAQLIGGDAEAAVATLTPLLDNLNTEPADLELLVRAARQIGHPSADAWAAHAAAPDFRRRAPLLSAGQLALQVHDWPGAATAFGALAAQGPSLGSQGQIYVLSRLAYARARGGQPAAALDTAQVALALAPADIYALKAAGLARLALGKDLAMARQQVRQVLASASQDYEAVLLLDRLASAGG